MQQCLSKRLSNIRSFWQRNIKAKEQNSGAISRVKNESVLFWLGALGAHLARPGREQHNAVTRAATSRRADPLSRSTGNLSWPLDAKWGARFTLSRPRRVALCNVAYTCESWKIVENATAICSSVPIRATSEARNLFSGRRRLKTCPGCYCGGGAVVE